MSSSRGRQVLPGQAPLGRRGGERQAAWQVDLMHAGLIVESYYFSEQGRLLAVETPGFPTALARVSDEAAARSTADPAAPPTPRK